MVDTLCNKILIHCIINSPISSNGYIIYIVERGECVIIDPGSKDVASYVNFLDKYNLSPIYIFLTHEDFDHSWGAANLREQYGCKIICHEKASTRLAQPLNSFNLFYYNDSSYFSISNIEYPVSDFPYFIDCLGSQFTLLSTPGHTDSSISIMLNNNVFSGDSLLNETKPIIKKRNGGCRELYDETVKKLTSDFCNSIVYPGHGDCFKMDQYKAY
jgi:glyoxylase-like metal-dependent hydrolase (beta-lactamase superfamily II)